jgi:acetyl-CoA carboxylase biotin carboxylase subunit
VFKKVLIANRGEIAVRLIKACQGLGVTTVAVYSEADAQAQHRWLADEAILLGPASPAESYLHGERIIAVAQQTNCQAIHPGYGFLSENADFATAVAAAGLVFIGPTAAAIRLMGDKIAARHHAQAIGIPVIPGLVVPTNKANFETGIAEIGYPVLIKAAAGGGGKGMRLVQQADDLPQALSAARREAQHAFGDETLYLEKYLLNPRHIEIQLLADQHGQIVHLFERDCSIQRRHQKIIEETPAPFLAEELRQAMAAAAIKIASSVDYVNAGTVEFLVEQAGNFYFLEMNTRLQVEHPITEALTGLDLVQWQLAIASGQPLTLTQATITARGHALECRLYAEDPANQFLPATGTILHLREPQGNGVRVDSGVVLGDQVTVHYDPLLAKIIVHAADREAALRTMRWALKQTVLLGLPTNLPLLHRIFEHPAFIAGQTDTHFLTDHFPAGGEVVDSPPDLAFIAAALSEHLNLITSTMPQTSHSDTPFDPWQQGDGFRVGSQPLEDERE